MRISKSNLDRINQYCFELNKNSNEVYEQNGLFRTIHNTKATIGSVLSYLIINTPESINLLEKTNEETGSVRVILDDKSFDKLKKLPSMLNNKNQRLILDSIIYNYFNNL